MKIIYDATKNIITYTGFTQYLFVYLFILKSVLQVVYLSARNKLYIRISIDGTRGGRKPCDLQFFVQIAVFVVQSWPSNSKNVCDSHQFNPLNPELNPICYLLALLGAHHFLHVSRIRVKSLTFRRLMSYIYIYIWSTHS